MDHSCEKEGRRGLVWLLALLGALAVLMAYALHEWLTPCPQPEQILSCQEALELAYAMCEMRRVVSLLTFVFTLPTLVVCVAMYVVIVFNEEKNSCSEEVVER